jgi:hypothetical protein
MHKHPTPTIKGSRPQNLPHRQSDDVAKLSKRYLQVRNHAIDLKSKAAELELAVRRGQLIFKDLAVKQASFLMIVLRQSLLNLPVHAHKLVGLDADSMRKALREIAIDIERINEDRRKGVEQSIQVISMGDLNPLARNSSRFWITPGGSCSLSSSKSTPATQFTTASQMMGSRLSTAPQRRKACGSRGVEPWVHCRRGQLRP